MSYGLQVVYNMRGCRPGQKQFLMIDKIRFFLIIYWGAHLFYCKNFTFFPVCKVEPLKVTSAETYCINFTALAGAALI